MRNRWMIGILVWALIWSCPSVLHSQFSYVATNGTVTITVGAPFYGFPLVIPNTIDGMAVTRIGSNAFARSQGLISVTLPDTLQSIDAYAFANTWLNGTLSIPGGVTNIGPSAFYNCSQLTNVILPDVLQSMGDSAFASCPQLKTFRVPTGMTAIADYTFAGCTNLSEVDFGTNITSIGSFAFEDCMTLVAVEIPDSVKDLGMMPFYGCSRVQNVTIGNGVTDIYNLGLGNSGVLTNFQIGANVDRISAPMFNGCTNLPAISVSSSNNTFVSLGGVLFNKTATMLIGYPAGKSGEYTVPAGVTNIGDHSFAMCPSLTAVTFPDTVLSIEAEAFADCGSLTNLVLPDSVDSIGQGAFLACTNLVSITYGAGLTTVSSTAFAGCSGLVNINVSPDNTVFSGVSGALFDKSGKNILMLPYGTAGDYVIPAGVTNIGAMAFAYCSKLDSVTIPAGVSSIGYNAFLDCSQLDAFYFQGDAPDSNSNPLLAPPRTNAVVYYLPGTVGWTNSWGGTSTPLWQPQLQMEAGAGSSPAFGFNINWADGQTVVVEACTNLTNPVWLPLITNTLIGGTSLITDPQWTNFPGRYYRVRTQ